MIRLSFEDRKISLRRSISPKGDGRGEILRESGMPCVFAGGKPILFLVATGP
jgi:hypothetical protein